MKTYVCITKDGKSHDIVAENSRAANSAAESKFGYANIVVAPQESMVKKTGVKTGDKLDPMGVCSRCKRSHVRYDESMWSLPHKVHYGPDAPQCKGGLVTPTKKATDRRTRLHKALDRAIDAKHGRDTAPVGDAETFKVGDRVAYWGPKGAKPRFGSVVSDTGNLEVIVKLDGGIEQKLPKVNVTKKIQATDTNWHPQRKYPTPILPKSTGAGAVRNELLLKKKITDSATRQRLHRALDRAINQKRAKDAREFVVKQTSKGWLVFEDGQPGYPFPTKEKAVQHAKAVAEIRKVGGLVAPVRIVDAIDPYLSSGQ